MILNCACSYLSLCLFLSTISNVDFESHVDGFNHEGDLDTQMSAEEESPVPETAGTESGVSELPQRPRKKKRDCPKSPNTQINEKLVDFLASPTVPPKEHDETELFLLSLAPQIRSLGKREQTRAKIEMLRILDDLDVQSQTHHGQGVPSYHLGPPLFGSWNVPN